MKNKNTNMASLFGLFSTFLFILLTAAINTPSVGAFKEFRVGDSEGWQQPGDNHTAFYDQWAATNRFLVGDSLRFEYKNDSVLVVDKWGYFHCNMSNPISTFNNGNNTVVSLDNPGSMYFISGDPDHCKNGQRLVIQVMTLHSISNSPPSIATSPESYLAESPSPLSSSGASVSVSVTFMISVVVTCLWCAP
ncbi:unnamed protein product [Camellia sinensis]